MQPTAVTDPVEREQAGEPIDVGFGDDDVESAATQPPELWLG